MNPALKPPQLSLFSTSLLTFISKSASKTALYLIISNKLNRNKIKIILDSESYINFINRS